MSPRLLRITRRKQELIERAAMQRVAVGACIERWQTPSRLVDRALYAAAFLKSRPWVLAPVVAAILIARPRRIARWAGRAFVVWRGWRVAQTFLR